jgi:hypothetical protein
MDAGVICDPIARLKYLICHKKKKKQKVREKEKKKLIYAQCLCSQTLPCQWTFPRPGTGPCSVQEQSSKIAKDFQSFVRKSSHWSCFTACFKGYTFSFTTFLVRPSTAAQQSHQ